jgi:hypothetical protein
MTVSSSWSVRGRYPDATEVDCVIHDLIIFIKGRKFSDILLASKCHSSNGFIGLAPLNIAMSRMCRWMHLGDQCHAV